jgi:transposase
MTRIVKEQYGDPEQALPKLLELHGSPALVAKAIATDTGETVSPNAVRKWLEKRGWSLKRSEWRPPETDSTPAILDRAEERAGGGHDTGQE